MSALSPGAPESFNLWRSSLGPDGVRRYKTKCKILIDSHDIRSSKETIVLEEDVFEVETAKTIKGPGQATVTLTPSNNYLNLVFPNDYINIYFDIGDGTGWIRTFFGFIDRVEESYVVNKDGIPKTNYKLYCTDFFKAFESTMIYFNPHLVGRRDFVSYDFAANNIGGLVLLSKGIIAGGSPPDVVINVLQLLIGFGTQFLLPGSYQPGDTQKRLRRRRAELVYGTLTDESKDHLGSVYGSYADVRKRFIDEAADIIDQNSVVPADKRISALAKALGIPESDLGSATTNDNIKRIYADAKIKDLIEIKDSERSLQATDNASKNAALSLLNSTIASSSSLADIVDSFTFVERRAIDGFMFGLPVWQRQGSLASILRSFSNESINELFFDLRPLSQAPFSPSDISDRPNELFYSVAPDDKGGNKADEETPVGPTHIPAVVMREYPFSTIDGLNLNKVQLQLLDERNNPESIGLLYFGPIFSDKPNTPGRHVITTPNINISDIAENKDEAVLENMKGIKHLDVAVISEEEIIASTLGRSDNDHFNLFEFYSDNVLGTDQRFYLRDFLPIITPIHILRNGIKVRTITTRAARFSIHAIRNMRSAHLEEQLRSIEQQYTEERKELEVTVGSLVPPVFPGDTDIVRFHNRSSAQWGYRFKSGINAYAFHHGIDISRLPEEQIPLERRTALIPIRAIADGEVVIAAPEGAFTGYGNIVVIKHKFGGDIGIRYSVYAHLSSISGAASFHHVIPKTISKGKRGRYAAKGAPGVGRPRIKKPRFIKQGTVLGYMGSTGFDGDYVHLHFEIDKYFPPRNDKYTPREATYPGKFPSTFDPGGTNNSRMLSANQNSCDPVSFFGDVALVDLIAEINQGSSTLDNPENIEPGDVELGDSSAEDTTQKPIEDTEQDTGKELQEDEPAVVTDRSLVDTASSRRQIIRWALLQDHWYQHNLEYLSGRIDMRGAPEIRVGYRLDIRERNMSSYIESVNHKWQFPNAMHTTLGVTRVQPNNPYPLYVYPNSHQLDTPSEQRRDSNSRLATYFITPDPVAIRRSIFIRNSNPSIPNSMSKGAGINVVDHEQYINYDPDSNISTVYGEVVLPAGSTEYSRAAEERKQEVELEQPDGTLGGVGGANTDTLANDIEEI